MKNKLYCMYRNNTAVFFRRAVADWVEQAGGSAGF